MLESLLELTDVLGSVGEEHSVAVNIVVEPFADILDPVVIFEFIGLYPFEEVLVLLWERRVFVVWKAQFVVESEIEFLQFGSDLGLDRFRDGDNFGFRGKAHFGEDLLNDGVGGLLFLADEGVMDGLLVDE